MHQFYRIDLISEQLIISYDAFPAQLPIRLYLGGDYSSEWEVIGKERSGVIYLIFLPRYHFETFQVRFCDPSSKRVLNL